MNDIGREKQNKEVKESVLLISCSPHIHSGRTVRSIMLDVIIALVPAFIWAVWFFGIGAFVLVAVCVVSCVFFEAICRILMKRRQSIGDLSAVVTGILLAFNLPPKLPLWMAITGSFFAIVVAKQIFGGIGFNPFNPALVGRAVLLISCPMAMTTWSAWKIPLQSIVADGIDAVTTATPLGIAKICLARGEPLPFIFNDFLILDFFIGRMNGCIGEVSALALIIGGIYLLIRRCITWETPVFYMATVGIFAWILHLIDPQSNMPALFHLLTGGLMLGAIFMATDMVTTPVTRKGKIIFGIGCGLLTMIIRKWGGYPEGVSFSILFMNALTPLINKFTKPRVFGERI